VLTSASVVRVREALAANGLEAAVFEFPGAARHG